MTEQDEAHGPGLIQYILLDCDDLDDAPRFKPVIKWKDSNDNDHWDCGECKKTLPYHTSDCPVHAAYLEAEKARAEYVRPAHLCTNCDQPKEGPHRFSCARGGARSTQVVLPVTQNSDGSFSVDPPYSSSK